MAGGGGRSGDESGGGEADGDEVPAASLASASPAQASCKKKEIFIKILLSKQPANECQLFLLFLTIWPFLLVTSKSNLWLL